MSNLQRSRRVENAKSSLIIIALVTLILIILSQMNFAFVGRYKHFYLQGTTNTIVLAFFAVIFGVLLGVIISLMRISQSQVLKIVSASYVEFIRGTPLLVQLYIIYYGLPMIGIRFFDIRLPIIGTIPGDFIAGIVTLSINSAAYVSEIIRAGIQAVDKGQMEASRSLGLTYATSMRYVIFPQALKNILPALGNEFIVVIKESSIVSVIGIADLMYKADTVRTNTFQPFEPLIFAALIYFVLTFGLSKLLGLIEKRMKKSDSSS